MSAVTMRRSPYGLTADRADPWQTRAVCDATTVHLFVFDDGRGIRPHENRAAARGCHICLQHCPVRVQCRRDAEEHRPLGAVQGGVFWPTKGRARWLPDPGCGDHCGHLRGGR